MGNDVVDLHDPDNRGKSGDDRFLARVFTAEERGLIARAADPDRLLWSLWAAKEAAYKAVSGGEPGLCSVPHRYPVHLDLLPRGEHPTPEAQPSPLGSEAGIEADGLLTGRVLTPRGAVALRIATTREYVHALAASADVAIAGIVHRVDRLDNGGNPGDPSAFVRAQLLTEISRRLNCPREELTVRADSSASGAPRVFSRDLPLSLAISLSHDGRFTAFAFLLR
ncbi:MAG: 4'-phosphopantetheinyl transferase family protein [Syntrophales bacterium]